MHYTASVKCMQTMSGPIQSIVVGPIMQLPWGGQRSKASDCNPLGVI